jgi:RNA-directed DNA polymerase
LWVVRKINRACPGRSRVDKSDQAGKPFDIPKLLVWEAYRRVRANKGAAGVDRESLALFETDLRDNLYRIWNRMSSGAYFPPPVKAVEIPKAGGGVRVLGVPTVADRVAQTVVALSLEPRTEAIFHRDSYGYRPHRSALQALEVCRSRCWKYGWVIDLDIQKFFDSVDHDLMIKAVEANTDQRWVVLYVKRWLVAPLQLPDGTLAERDRGTPQGSAVSPVLANLFMHYAFDLWLEREFPTVRFERYADDAVVHCATERQAREVLAALSQRMVEVGLRLHPNKTKIVHCRDGNRPGVFPVVSFTFLGYTFRPRAARNVTAGKTFTAFTPAASPAALKEMGRRVRFLRIQAKSRIDLRGLAAMLNPIVAGWMQYYGRFNRSSLHPLLRRINSYLMRWAANKYKRLRSYRRCRTWWLAVFQREPTLFAHWRWNHTFAGFR